ncbi:MAG: GNAT family N-acetyltransferase [Flavobacteriaceae bacterium]|nr:GNAT family N-acetyltransferase [Flavobacteriaceae bacterium]
MNIQIANKTHFHFAEVISKTIQSSAKVRGTGIALRSPEYIKHRMANENSVIAVEEDKFAGFCYIEIWGEKNFVAHSGLIVHPDFRGRGLAKQIKKAVLDLSLEKFPNAKIFGITTGAAVMKINYELGYKPVTFDALTDDDDFWKGCQTCINFDVLQRMNRNICLCTGMLYDQHLNKKNEQ